MKNIIDGIFNKIEYWQDKRLLLRAISFNYYSNKKVILQLLNISSANVSEYNIAKCDMWNHQISQYKLGDDILKNTDQKLLEDFDFAKQALYKYNRTYLFLPKNFQASKELALIAATKEIQSSDDNYKEPILQYMPQTIRDDVEIALTATSRNIENLKYSNSLKRNKYFIIDIMTYMDDHKIKQKVLQYIDKDLLEDKKFVAQLGCFDNLCENFHNDTEYVASAVARDINILKKTKMFDESILKAVLKSDEYHHNKDKTLSLVFRYIEKFNDNFDELNSKIKDKRIISKLFWDFGSTVSYEFI